MYCPKCGGQNSDDLAYCRECGENLKIISQAMERTFPHVVASKIDAAIEKKNGRLIRGAATTGIFGILYGAWNFLTPIDPHSLTAWFPFLRFVLPGFFFLASVYYILTYRRSVEIEGRTARFADGDVGSSSIFCTNCRAVNDSAHRFCHSCGHDQAIRPQGLASVLPAFILRILDGGVARNEAVFRRPRSRLAIAVSTLAAFALAGYSASFGVSWMTLLMVFGGLVNFVTNGWDNLTYARNKGSKLGTTNDSSLLSTDNSETSGSHQIGHLGAFLHEMRNIPITDEPIDYETRDTRPLELVSLGVTEATTEPLNSEMEFVNDVPTTRKLDGSTDD